MKTGYPIKSPQGRFHIRPSWHGERNFWTVKDTRPNRIQSITVEEIQSPLSIVRKALKWAEEVAECLQGGIWHAESRVRELAKLRTRRRIRQERERAQDLAYAIQEEQERLRKAGL